MPRRGPPADPTSLHFLLLSFPLSAGPAVPGQGILIKIQCTVTNRSEQSLISTRVRRGLALITAHLEETIKWIDKPFKREVNFFLAFGQEWISFIYSFKRNLIHLLTVFFLQKFFHHIVSSRERLSWLGGWLRGWLCYSCLCWPAKAYSTALTTSHQRYSWGGVGCSFRSVT